jgi:hypothetical protein
MEELIKKAKQAGITFQQIPDNVGYPNTSDTGVVFIRPHYTDSQIRGLINQKLEELKDKEWRKFI